MIKINEQYFNANLQSSKLLAKSWLVETKESGNCFIATLARVLHANNLRVSLADIEMAFGPWKEVVGFLTADQLSYCCCCLVSWCVLFVVERKLLVEMLFFCIE